MGALQVQFLSQTNEQPVKVILLVGYCWILRFMMDVPRYGHTAAVFLGCGTNETDAEQVG